MRMRWGFLLSRRRHVSHKPCSCYVWKSEVNGKLVRGCSADVQVDRGAGVLPLMTTGTFQISFLQSKYGKESIYSINI
jgi:hypothetical protein